jgi:hypothetical protein
VCARVPSGRMERLSDVDAVVVGELHDVTWTVVDLSAFAMGLELGPLAPQTRRHDRLLERPLEFVEVTDGCRFRDLPDRFQADSGGSD